MRTQKNNTPVRKAPYDWRDGICQFCGVEATKGCCERHSMECPLCFGYGAVSKRIWDKFSGKKVGHRTMGTGLKVDELKEYVCEKIDAIDRYGCESCWADLHNCTCQKDKNRMKIELLEELEKRLTSLE